jgi:hypothetical protein
MERSIAARSQLSLSTDGAIGREGVRALSLR